MSANLVSLILLGAQLQQAGNVINFLNRPGRKLRIIANSGQPRDSEASRRIDWELGFF